MASKKKAVTRKFINDPSKAKEAYALSRKVKRDFTQLLKRGEAGKMTEAQLDISLKEIDLGLRQMLLFKRHSLR